MARKRALGREVQGGSIVGGLQTRRLAHRHAGDGHGIAVGIRCGDGEVVGGGILLDARAIAVAVVEGASVVGEAGGQGVKIAGRIMIWGRCG